MKQMDWFYSGVGFAFLLSFVTHPDLFDPKSLAGKRVLITGMQSDIARAIAFQYARYGARLFLVGDSRTFPPTDAISNLRELSDRCLQLGAHSVHLAKGDLTQEQFRSHVIRSATQRLNGLDYLVLHHVRRSSSSARAAFAAAATRRDESGSPLDAHFLAQVDLTSKALPILSGGVGVISPLFGGKIPPAGSHREAAAAVSALHGFFPALRQELAAHNASGPSVTSVALGFVDSRTDPEYVAMQRDDFLYDYVVAALSDAALMVVKSVTEKKREITFPFPAQVHVAAYNLFPSLYETFVSRAYNQLSV